MTHELSDFRPTASLDTLRRRADLLRQVRAFFDARGFLEVETPILSADVVVDRHLDPLTTVLADDPRRPQIGRTLYLQTSPEFAMKRLLAAGATAIYQVTKAFRNGERGPRHNPEFTIVEWYRVGDDLAAGMRLLSDFAETLLGRGPAECVSYGEAFRAAVGFCPHTAPVEQLCAAAEQREISTPASAKADDRDLWLELLLGECVEPSLGVGRPTILYDYPAGQAALARTRRTDGPGEPSYEVAERFELYADGVELANGYHELLDAEVLVERNKQNNAARAADGKPRLPEHCRLIDAMRHGLPACCGVALGFDRLVMVAIGAQRIDEVIPFTIERA